MNEKYPISPIPNITLRLSDKEMFTRIVELSEEHHQSLNLTVQMLLGYAFNQIDETGKKFVSKVVFESE